MGQCKSTDPISLGPFAAAKHTDACHMRDVINKRDFVAFLGELKRTLSLRDSIAFVAEGMTFNHEGDDPDVLAYKVSVDGAVYHHVYLKCQCPRKYAGMNINYLDSRGQAALHVALRKRDFLLVRLLMNLGADPKQFSKLGLTPLHIACETGDVAALSLLLQTGVDPNTHENHVVSCFYHHFRTALTISASNGDLQCMSQLLDAGADVDVPDSSGNTALHKAALFGHTACLKVLLLKGANPNIQNYLGAPPLQLALLQIHTDIVRMLVKAGSDVKLCSTELPSNLTLAALTGEAEIVHKCAETMDNMDVRDRTGRNALYYTFTGDTARLKTHYPVVADIGINVDFQYCQLNRRAETLSFLVETGSDVECVLRDAFDCNILTAKHFTLPHNVDMFTLCLKACGFVTIPLSELDHLFWKLLMRKNSILVRMLVSALPRIDGCIRNTLQQVKDWTGAHTPEAVREYLESHGAEEELASWIEQIQAGPRTLQCCCRHAIRASISRNVVHSVQFLPLPASLKDYVTLGDVTS